MTNSRTIRGRCRDRETSELGNCRLAQIVNHAPESVSQSPGGKAVKPEKDEQRADELLDAKKEIIELERQMMEPRQYKSFEPFP